MHAQLDKPGRNHYCHSWGEEIMDVSDSTHTHQRSIGADQTTVVALPKPEAIRLQMMMMIIILKDDDDGDDCRQS